MILQYTAQRRTHLRNILRQELQMSSTLVKRLKYCHAFRVNGLAVHTDHIVQVGDTVCVHIEEAQPEYPAQEGALDVLYEDDALIAVDKPVGILVHPSRARNTGTLANRLIAYYQQTGQRCAVHPVSRLDRDTFGVVLLAKNAHIHARFCAQARAGGIQKRYHAAVFGVPAQMQGMIDAPIARVSETSLLRCIREDGKPAQSAYAVLDERDACSLLELHPLTGRTHQLRLHCAYLGCPILGDPQYGSPQSQAYSVQCGIEGQQLCAHTVGFSHPLTGERIEIFSRQSVRF